MSELSLLNAQTVAAFPGKKLVFGEGVLSPFFMLIGEAPGENEEKEGRPFVGHAGQNLNEFLSLIDLDRAALYVSNTVKFRPCEPGPTGRLRNRPPKKDEIEAFAPYLTREIQIVSPKMLVTLGNVPLQAVMQDRKIVIGDVHGRMFDTPHGIPLFPLYHPASVIYRRELKDTYVADILKLKEIFDHER